MNTMAAIKKVELMAKYMQCNPHLGIMYDIPEKVALRKINSKWWFPAWDDYYEEYSDSAWYDIRDPERSWIFKVEE